MNDIFDKKLKEIIQSGHINLLIGAGCSNDYIPGLGNIETRMNVEKTKEQAQRDYYGLVKKSKAILKTSLEKNDTEKSKLFETKDNYDSFLGFWARTISKRSLHIVNKQVNVFTTNFDMFMEDSCERLGIPYNDGFIGQIDPTFKVSNFNKVQKYKSLQFDNTSDIPLFNIIKLHGSVSWQKKSKKIVYSNGAHIANNLANKQYVEFAKGYDKIAVINPNAKKHVETVLNVNYASMLRKFTLELEKENSVLLVFGFSMADQHIKNLLYGVIESNPTLIVIYFSYCKYDTVKDELDANKHHNFHVISPKANYSFKEATESLSKVIKDETEENGVPGDGE